MDDANASIAIDEASGTTAVIPQTLWQAAVELQRFLDSCQFRFCFIGGIAFQRWGEPRVTDDMDATICVEFGSESPVIETVLKRYQARIANPAQFALQSRVILVQDLSGFGIDLSLGGLDVEHRVVERSSMWGVPGAGHIRTCCAEDLVTLKAFASRPQDWIDVEKVIIRQGDRLDRSLIRQELAPLVGLKEEPEIMEHLEQLFSKHP